MTAQEEQALKELLVARYNDAVRRLQGHAATDAALVRVGEPRDSDATDRLRMLYLEARFDVSALARLLGPGKVTREQLDRVAERTDFDDWRAFEDDSLPSDPSPADHGAGHKPQYVKPW